VLTKIIHSLETFGAPSDSAVLLTSLLSVFPYSFMSRAFDVLGGKRMKIMKRVETLTDQVARKLVAQNSASLENGDIANILALCIKSNATENPRGHFNEREMIAQIRRVCASNRFECSRLSITLENRTIIFAGHETTATTTTWALFELARNMDLQDKLRNEILQKRQMKRARQDLDWSWKDFEEMPLLTAFMKVFVCPPDKFDDLSFCIGSTAFSSHSP
jgi:cytochrome P450